MNADFMARAEVYTKTVKRLQRGGHNDPTNQIIELSLEIDRYREKIYHLENALDASNCAEIAKQTIKDHERIFFALCFNMRNIMKPRSVVHVLCDTIPHKRCWYYLEKWHRLGFYSSGVSSDLGWFYPEKLPQRYLEIVSIKEAQHGD